MRAVVLRLSPPEWCYLGELLFGNGDIRALAREKVLDGAAQSGVGNMMRGMGCSR
jgi:hypothetical protein